MTQSKPSVFDLANAFLSIEAMSPKRLQKMCYYAKAWHLALEDENIVDEPFEAWVHGPANMDIYQKYKEYGFNAIPKISDTTSIPADLLAFAHKIFDSYGALDAYDLENLSHKEAPWMEARGALDPWAACRTVISEARMKDYYRGLME